ncbi:MAG: carboxypeptidase-like regulatory domain-containing protein, partial [Bacteroidia bacterium]
MQPFLYLLSFLFFSFCYLPLLQAQQSKYTVSGYVKDSTNGETLIGATVRIKDTQLGAAANAYGFYNITLPAGEYVLVFSYLGFEAKEVPIHLTKNTTVNTTMAVKGIETKAVIITADRTDRNVKSTEMSRLEISGKELKQLPVIMGEPDVLKAITLLPGIKSGGEASNGFYVRGGGPDQNLVLMDEGVIYNPSHLLGFLSVFNADAVRNV